MCDTMTLDNFNQYYKSKYEGRGIGMKKRCIRILAICLLALLMIWNTWGTFSELEHDCSNEYCFLCHLFTQSNEMLKLLWFGFWMLALPLLTCASSGVLQAHTRGMLVEFSTPVWLRDKLSD